MKRIEETLEFRVLPHQKDLRIDRFLALTYPELSRSYLKRLIEDGFVLVNGAEARKPSRKVREGEVVTLLVPASEPLEVKPEKIPLEVIYEDEDIAVIVKPCGLVVHPSPGYTSGTLVNALLYHIGDLSSEGGVQRPGIVHRLDKATAGLMVVAKNDHAHRNLSEQFAKRDVYKVYRALVFGIPREDHMLIDMPLGRHPYDRKKFKVSGINSREALTEYWVLEAFEALSVSLLKVRIYTGRTHQIRVHLSSIGHPVLGDRVYGFKGRGIPRNVLRLIGECNMLVATELAFRHPSGGKAMEFSIGDPEPFGTVLQEIRDLNGSLG